MPPPLGRRPFARLESMGALLLLALGGLAIATLATDHEPLTGDFPTDEEPDASLPPAAPEAYPGVHSQPGTVDPDWGGSPTAMPASEVDPAWDWDTWVPMEIEPTALPPGDTWDPEPLPSGSTPKPIGQPDPLIYTTVHDAFVGAEQEPLWFLPEQTFVDIGDPVWVDLGTIDAFLEPGSYQLSIAIDAVSYDPSPVSPYHHVSWLNIYVGPDGRPQATAQSGVTIAPATDGFRIAVLLPAGLFWAQVFLDWTWDQ